MDERGRKRDMTAVVIKVMGGLASQLHKYAIGRTIADQHACKLMLDLSWFASPGEGDTPREFLLDHYRARYSVASAADINALKSNRLQRRLSSLSLRMGLPLRFLKRTHYIRGLDKREVLDCVPPVYIEGEWFGGRFLERDEQNLRRDFQLTHALDSRLVPLLEQMRQSGSVAVHVRRGDFVHGSTASSFHHVAGVSYYARAMDLFRSRLGAPRFFVFSDDYAWVQDNFRQLGNDLVFVPENAAFEDLALMSSCSHQVIANSGFSWFGAWLNQNPEKMLAAPRHWVKDPVLNAEILSDLVTYGFEVVDGNE